MALPLHCKGVTLESLQPNPKVQTMISVHSTLPFVARAASLSRVALGIAALMLGACELASTSQGAGDDDMLEGSDGDVSSGDGALEAGPTLINTEPGVFYFDEFDGSTTDDKIRSMNDWAGSLGSGTARPSIVFDSKVYKHSVPIDLRSGLSLVGGRRTAAREYGTGTVLKYQGSPGTSQLVFVTNNQGYPSDGSPRDISFDSIQFVGNAEVHHVEKHDPSGGDYQSKVLWYVSWNNCGFVGFQTIWWGWGDGAAMTGITHAQAIADTAFFIGGSENHFFQDYSFIDSGTGAWASSGKPFFISNMSKSSIGRMMFSARSNSYQLSIVGGTNLIVDGTAFDAPYSAPTAGKQISISDGDGIRITNASFKGGMSNPSAASGGSAANRGMIHITGGTQIVIEGNNFLPPGALLYVGPKVGANQVKWGLNGYPENPGAQLRQYRAGQIVNLDPTVSVVVAP